ncbi:OmpA family protein [Frigidibacter sp. RF13]|uniref:OmpA family protein n=1 Tax=Frigidibacter sp. RF13 TaxID=2997340 RepID=UPI0022713525|nr:OmpA family protein [Frigidibacter sp. RF13]MCY1127731.1 OmpA family protein [Frigidibacter sp. RF13]
MQVRRVKIRLPQTFPAQAIGPSVFAVAALLCFLLSIWTVDAIERFSRLGVRRVVHEAGLSWVNVDADGLQLILSGTAPTEALRFRALSVAGETVDSSRLVDSMTVAAQAELAAPEFNIEILRNDDGLSLIGLAPATLARDGLVADLGALAGEGEVTDMLETADHPVPEGWDSALRFALDALKSLPRSKISVTPGKVAVTAIGDSAEEKRQIESRLRKAAPSGLALALSISAPRPVIAPFTLRFLIEDGQARFDACSADNDKSRRRILQAALDAGAKRTEGCTIGLGMPTPDWDDAVIQGIRAVKKLGSGSITFSDTSVALLAGPEVPQSTFDSVTGDLESNLPRVFTLTAAQTAAPVAGEVGVEFSAVLDDEGKVALEGRLRDELSRDAVESYARSRFGAANVYGAARIDPDLPAGWPERVLVSLEALAELHDGKVVVQEGDIAIEGRTGDKDASGRVSRLLSSKLGATGRYRIAVRYDDGLDPTAGLPTDQECVDRVNSILAEKQIVFEPGSATIVPGAKPTLDRVADAMKDCADYPIEVGGHTDSQGREEMNMALSEQRARAVIVALQARRILTGNLTPQGYGETQPVMANDTEENREKNRRIEFRLLTPALDELAAEEGSAEGEAAIVVQSPDDKTLRPKKRPDTIGKQEP